MGAGTSSILMAPNPHSPPPHTFTSKHCVQSPFGQHGLQIPPSLLCAGIEAGWVRARLGGRGAFKAPSLACERRGRAAGGASAAKARLHLQFGARNRGARLGGRRTTGSTERAAAGLEAGARGAAAAGSELGAPAPGGRARQERCPRSPAC